MFRLGTELAWMGDVHKMVFRMMKSRLGSAITGMAAMLSLPAHAQSAAPSSFENLDRLRQRVAEFAARDGAARDPRIDRRLRLAECDALPELLWYGTGQSTVLVRCAGSRSWQIYVPVPLAHDHPAAAANPVKSGIVVVTRPVPRGAVLDRADLRIEPASVVPGGVSDVDQLVGRMAVRALNPGEAVRANMVAVPPLVKRGDPVQIKNGVAGLEISVQGMAEEDGAQGSRIRVRNAGTGERLQGIVAGPGIIVLPGYKNPEAGRE